MRLISHRVGGAERLGVVLDDDTVVDASTLDQQLDVPTTMVTLVEGERPALDRLRSAVVIAQRDGRLPSVRAGVGELDLAPPLGRVGKLIAVGKNYRDHAAEEGATTPTEPLLFAKFSSSLMGHDGTISWRAADTVAVDYEAELGVVIGARVKDVLATEALEAVLGYTCLNDISARDVQVQDGQWVRAKSFDTFCPIGPWLVTADDVPDPGALRVRCLVNGEVMQDAPTTQMVYGVAELIAFCSRFMTLEPGDVIATGTPGGVGAFRDPPRFLGHGDEVVVDIAGIGLLRNTCQVT